MSKFNVSDQTFVFDLAAHKWSILMAEGHHPVAREWHTALGVGEQMVRANSHSLRIMPVVFICSRVMYCLFCKYIMNNA